MTKFELDLTLRQPFLPDDQMIGGTDQIGVVELDPGPLVTVVPQDLAR